MSKSFAESVAEKTVKYLTSCFPGKKLVLDNKVDAENAEPWGFSTITIYVKEVDGVVHYKTNITGLNQYLS